MALRCRAPSGLCPFWTADPGLRSFPRKRALQPSHGALAFPGLAYHRAFGPRCRVSVAPQRRFLNPPIFNCVWYKAQAALPRERLRKKLRRSEQRIRKFRVRLSREATRAAVLQTSAPAHASRATLRVADACAVVRRVPRPLPEERCWKVPARHPRRPRRLPDCCFVQRL